DDQAGGAAFLNVSSSIGPCSVVAELDYYVASVVIGADRKSAGGVFPRRFAGLRVFDAVIDRVANHMSEWIFEMLHHAGVNLDLCALDDQSRAFMMSLGEIADGPHMLPEDGADRDHADLHDQVLEFQHEPVGFLTRFHHGIPI